MLSLLLSLGFSPGLPPSRILPPLPQPRPALRAPSALAALAADAGTDTDTESALLGQVVMRTRTGMLAISPERRAEAKVGSLLAFASGGTGVLLFERCGYYFARALGGAAPAPSEPVELLAANLSVPVCGEWGGVYDYRMGGGGESAASPRCVQVFGEPVAAAGRRPIGRSLHTGVVAVDALTPIGCGQSMALFGPNGLPEGAGRTDLSLRILEAQHLLGGGVKCVLVLAGDERADEKARVVERLRASGAISNVRVVMAEDSTEAYIAASAACSFAEAHEGDVLVVVDHLGPYLELWRDSCDALEQLGVVVAAEEEGAQQRSFYSRLVERASRRKASAKAVEGSLTLLLVQPSVSVLAEAPVRKAFSVDDFESFSNRVKTRVKTLADKGVELTEEVLVKVGIPLPGSDHPSTGKGQRSAQHLEELTSLVDGHIDLRENLAAKGRVPPLDPCNSLTRIGVGSNALRPSSTTPAMRSVANALRLELAAASDRALCDPAQARRAAAFEAVLQQADPAPLPLGEEVALLAAAAQGALDEAAASRGSDEMAELLKGFLQHIRAKSPSLLDDLTRKGVMLEPMEAELRALTQEYLTSA